MNTFQHSSSPLCRAAKAGALICAIAGSGFFAHAQSTSPLTPQPVPESSTATLIGNEPGGVSYLAREFVQQAAQANQTEIAMANVVESRSTNLAVKSFASMMRADHQQNFSELQQLAQSHAMVVDSALSSVNQHAVNHLQKISDANLDREFAKVMLKDHVKTIRAFDKASIEISEPYLKTYAQNTLPTLRKHLRHAEDAARAAGVDESTIFSILKGLPGGEAQRAVTYNQD